MSGGGGGGNGNQVTQQTVGVVDNVVSTTVESVVLPTIRSREVRFKAEGLMPNTRHFPFFDGVRVDNYCYPYAGSFDGETWYYSNRRNWEFEDVHHPDYQGEMLIDGMDSADFMPAYMHGHDKLWHPRFGETGPVDYGNPLSANFGGKLVSDANGVLEGSFFIPNNSELSFPTGERTFSLYDITSENRNNSASRASTIYFAQGVLETTTEQIVRDITVINQLPVPRRDDDDGSNGNDWQDPIAQSFRIYNSEGVFVTKIGVFFQSKDSGNTPVQLQIRPMVNGYPSADQFLPGTSKFLYPSDVSVSEDATAETVFELPVPTYLASGREYAIVLLTTSFDYNVWVSRLGDFALGETDRKITTQPYLGSLFKSQNSTTWESSQLDDLKFKIYRANFGTSTGTAILENESPQRRLLPADPLIFDSDNPNVVRVIHPSHGFTVNDDVRLLAQDSAITLPVQFNSISGLRNITAVDATGYTFLADSDATSFGRFGGNQITVDDQMMMDYMVPAFNYGNIAGTSVDFKGKFTTGKSLAGTETPYSKDAAFGKSFPTFIPYYFDRPTLIASRPNEVASMSSNRSATIQATLSTTSNYISPTLNLDRMSITGVNNIIDNQDSAATTDYNVPLYYVDETDPEFGSSVAKHVTPPITLETEAVGMRILLAANRPQGSNFKMYYRTIGTDANVREQNWILAESEEVLGVDTLPTTYREYEYLLGGPGGYLTPFVTWQLKIVMTSTNSSRPPSFRDLRVIALTV